MNPHYMFCDRAGWKASADKWTWGNPPNHRGILGAPLVAPGAPDVFLHHTVSSVTGDPCRDAKIVEAIGISRFGRISYSYVIHPSGVVLEGAGLAIGAHTLDHNSASFGLALIGNYEATDPTPEQVASLIDTINLLRLAGHLARFPNIRPHSDLKATACPGRLRASLNLIRERTRQ